MEEQSLELKPFSAFAYIKSDEELEAYIQDRISLAVLAERHVIDLLVAAGHVSAEKVEQARQIAADHPIRGQS